MAGYLNLTGRILLAELGASLGAKLLGLGGHGAGCGDKLHLDQRTIDTLEMHAMTNMRGGFDRALDDAGVPDTRAVRDALWKSYRSR